MPVVGLIAPALGAMGVSAGTASLIGAGASVAGGLLSGGGGGSAGAASNNATNAQLQGVREANALQKYMYDTTRADNAPGRAAQAGAFGALSTGLGLGGYSGGPSGGGGSDYAAYVRNSPDLAAEYARVSAPDGPFPNMPIEQFGQEHYTTFGQPEGRTLPAISSQGGQASVGGITPGMFSQKFADTEFRADPGYQFRLTEGINALDRSAAARGGIGSGGTLKALTRYAQGTADQTYNDAFNRFNTENTNIFNRYSNVAGLGQTATNQTGAAGQNYANNAGQNVLAGANAQANNIANQAYLRSQQQGNWLTQAQNLLGQVGNNAANSNIPQPSPYGYGFGGVPNNYGASGDTSLNGLF